MISPINAHRIKHVAALVCVLVGFTLLTFELLALMDLFAFERTALMQLLGWRAISLGVFLNIGMLILIVRAGHFLMRRTPRGRVRYFSNSILIASAFLTLWVLQYMFMERPLTVRIAVWWNDDREAVIAAGNRPDFSSFSLTNRVQGPESAHKLAIMYERILVNYPNTVRLHSIGSTIDKYADLYDLDPAFLFFRAYLNSFYGEAVSGPVPFARAMTAETVRDVVQIHLPARFIESDLRQKILSSGVLKSMFGSKTGFKLQYALHKATLDVSTQPYDVSTFSDIFMVLKEFPEEFPDVFSDGETDAIRVALKESFQSLKDHTLLTPYEQPYKHPPYDSAYYARYRKDLKKFARSAYYQTVMDFDFATRLQALLSRYQRDYFTYRLGAECWNDLAQWQRVVMLAMIRDLYTPNVGHLAYNLYALPELNNTPVKFVADQAVSKDGLQNCKHDALWLPKNSDYLWAGAAYQLRVLNEVWSLVNDDPIPGLGITDTVQDALDVIWLSEK